LPATPLHSWFAFWPFVLAPIWMFSCALWSAKMPSTLPDAVAFAMACSHSARTCGFVQSNVVIAEYLGTQI